MTMTATREQSVVRSFLNRTYSWMAAGLVLTAAIAYLTSTNVGLMQAVMQNRLLLFLAQLGIVFGMGFLLPRINSMVAGVLFLLYAALTGLTFSGLLLAFDQQALTLAFGTTALTFGAMSVVGYTTKRDLSGMGRFLMFTLIGLVLTMILNIWVGGTTLSMIISGVGVLLFAALTAYDTQKLKQMALSGVEGEAAEKGAIYGALTLYLDFINMFLFLLRLFSGSRN